MKKIHKMLFAFKQFPIVFLFFGFLISFAVLDELYPKRTYSDLENRPLAQRPAFSVAAIFESDPSQTWMAKYDSYTRDQVAFRDQWITLKSIMESLLLKTENNDVWYGTHDMMFAKQLTIGSRFEKNLTALERMSQRHPGLVDVMIVPSASFIQSHRLPAFAPVADENSALERIIKQLEGKATVYDLRPVLQAHRDEYIYYRTDHHWTADGAFYAYQNYAKKRGLPGFQKETAKFQQVPNFYGTNYSKARKFNAVADTISYPDLPNQLTIYDVSQPDGSRKTITASLYDKQAFAARDKYRGFLRGNHAFSRLHGNGKGRLLVVKDSYANAFVPYLINDYAEIDIVDFRANNSSIDKILSEHSYDRILVLYSFQGFASDNQFAGRTAIAG